MKAQNSTNICFVIFYSILFLIFTPWYGYTQVRVTAGAKGWYASWNLPIEKLPGTDQSDFSSAILTGPYLSFRISQFAATFSYSTSVKTFDATASNPGIYFYGFNGNRKLNREDINVFVNYSLIPEISVFANLKLLTYKVEDALTYINNSQRQDHTKISGTGIGLGIQVATSFGGGSPLYTFFSTGIVSNSFQVKEYTIKINEQIIPDVSYDSPPGSELLYFFDGGLGYRFLPSNLGAALGLRVENGKDTKTIIGPTANLFYTF